MHGQAHRHDIGDRVHRADLVEVDLIDRHAVGDAFRLGDEAVGRDRVFSHAFGQVEVVAQDVLHVADTGMMVVRAGVLVRIAMLRRMRVPAPVRVRSAARMRMVPIVRALLHAVDRHRHMRADDAARLGAVATVLNAGNAERFELCHEPVRIVEKLHERRGEHVAGRSHAAIEIERLHCFAPIWLIMPAR